VRSTPHALKRRFSNFGFGSWTVLDVLYNVQHGSSVSVAFLYWVLRMLQAQTFSGPLKTMAEISHVTM